MMSLTILHTNDLHAKLDVARAARLAAAASACGSAVLLLDAGDAVASGNVTFRPSGEPALDIMSATGYDAMAVGNREFHWARAGFRAKLRRARFPALCANVRNRLDDGDLPCRSDALLCPAPGLRVAVFGLTVPMITARMAASAVSPFVFDDPITVAREIVDRLRPTCDLLVCLSHVGVNVDRRIAEAAPDINLIVGGHTHAELPSGEMVGNTLIVQAGSHARLYGCVRADREAGSWRMAASLHPL